MARDVVPVLRCVTFDDAIAALNRMGKFRLAERLAEMRAASGQMTLPDQRHVCDYPTCSERGSGHPLACNCRSPTAR